MAYRIEYARSGRSACKGPIPCKGTKIEKGGLRLGSVIEIRGERSLVWRHWGCVTEKIISNLRENVGDPEDLDGIEELNEEDKQRISDAFSNGQIDESDVSPALIEAGKGPGGTPSSSPQKKSGPKKKAKKEESEEEPEEWKADESEEEVKPKKKNRANANANAKVKKEDPEPPSTAPALKRGRGKAVKEEEKEHHLEEAPKKRGRSSKSQKENVADAIAKEEEKNEVDEKPKKKRGRPSLSNGSESQTNGQSKAVASSKGNDKKALAPTAVPEKNKRGRKPAVKAEDEASTSLQEPPTNQQTGKKRGRPARANGH